MNWEQTLDKIEDKYGALIIFIGVFLMVVVMVMLGWVVMSAESRGINQSCYDMMLSDSWTMGYIAGVCNQTR